jgi:hypothetical protein
LAYLEACSFNWKPNKYMYMWLRLIKSHLLSCSILWKWKIILKINKALNHINLWYCFFYNLFSIHCTYTMLILIRLVNNLFWKKQLILSLQGIIPPYHQGSIYKTPFPIQNCHFSPISQKNPQSSPPVFKTSEKYYTV